ncbi:competence protein [Flavobacterium sp.]|uniref:competence protein n=1 Tax=Flavobacterium sp. TaxID=239 RepID=UPI0025F4627F|nr:competence protein [Flavobacterium sp.]
MAFEELKENAKSIQDHTQDYIESNIAYYKLKGFKVAMKSTSTLLKFFLIVLCFSMVLLFFSIAGAFFIGKLLNSEALGFLIVGGIYLFVTCFLFAIKDKLIEGTILEKFSEIFFND